MRLTLTLLDKTTGESRVYDAGEVYQGDLDHDVFFWTEGNFSCDCNRGLAFEWAAGIDTDAAHYEDRFECGHERFEITKAVVDGRDVSGQFA